MLKLHSKICLLFLLGAAFFCSSTVYAQFPSFFGKSTKGNRKKDLPSTVRATVMDIDMTNNVATLTGDVFVNDQEVTIRCDKMILYLMKDNEDKKQDAKNADPKKTKSDTKEQSAKQNDEEMNNMKLDRIECIGDVVFQTKQEEGVSLERREQKATAGKADYNIQTGVIILTENPVLIDGDRKVTGSKMVLQVNDNHMIIYHGEASAKNLKLEQENKK